MSAEKPNTEIHVETRTSIVYLLRTVHQHHVMLSTMADQKANILMGASFVILTLAFGQTGGEKVTPALGILIVSALMAALFAILAVMPSFRPGKAPQPSTFNPLFFGHFATLEQDQFIDRMNDILSSDDSVYQAMVIDIHQLGQVLHKKKYRYLTASYRVFLSGLILSSAAFLVQALMG